MDKSNGNFPTLQLYKRLKAVPEKLEFDMVNLIDLIADA